MSAICVAIEGLDGIGKSTLIRALQTELTANLVVTPPARIRKYRDKFTSSSNAMRYAYYLLGNYIAADSVSDMLRHQNVVLDRFHASTVAYMVGKDPNVVNEIENILTWPADLLKPDYMFVLTMDENERVERLCNRATQNGEQLTAEDIQIMHNPEMSRRINDIYIQMGCQEIHVKKHESTQHIVERILRAILKL